MERVKVFNLVVTLPLIFLASVPKMESHIRAPAIPFPPSPPHPLCASQLALVNYACARLPFTPGSPPSSQLISSDDDGEGHRSHHRHGHRHHRHSRGRRSTPQEDNCCRWAGEVDSQCVCEILVRLPPFLTRPSHQYTLTIGESCNVTYTCGGPI